MPELLPWRGRLYREPACTWPSPGIMHAQSAAMEALRSAERRRAGELCAVVGTECDVRRLDVAAGGPGISMTHYAFLIRALHTHP